MNGNETCLLKEITPRNLLSFGPETAPIGLRALNVLIGPNGSGKTNLIEAIALLRAAPTDLRTVVRKGGGVGEWIWKGNPKGEARLHATVIYREPSKKEDVLEHELRFRADAHGFHLVAETIEGAEDVWGPNIVGFYYAFKNGQAAITPTKTEKKKAKPTIVEPNVSILAQRRDPETYPEVTYLANTYESIRIYREWTFGRNAVFRQPQQADLRNDRLEEDFSNLGLFLNHLRKQPKVKQKILDGLRDLYEDFSDFDVSIEGGTVQVYFTEGAYTVPATRLSDGTLRYLCLLAILCDPEPPPLVCIEEPELGLHPDILPKVADMLVKASERTQLIVTTHSDILVDALTEMPEAVLVCEKHDGKTEINRLDEQRLENWLEKYRLGDLWTSGEIGGTRF